jgi:hypothetical protein
MDTVRTWGQGAAVWALLLAAAFTLPGTLWRPAQPPPFPVHALVPAATALGIVALGALVLARSWGPAACHSRALALWEAVPDLFWGAALLALRPAAWGPPGAGAWLLALAAAMLAGEVRWLAQALPAERPFPAAWGTAAQARWRGRTLRTLAPAWLGARLPVWVTASLVLERLLNVPGLGSDWMARAAGRDHAGLAAWVAAFALAWAVLQHAQGRRP